MPALHELELSTDDIDVLCDMINYFGEGSHPPATFNTFWSFEPDYVLECLEVAKVAAHSIPNTIEQVYALALKLEEFLKTQPSTI